MMNVTLYKYMVVATECGERDLIFFDDAGEVLVYAASGIADRIDRICLISEFGTCSDMTIQFEFGQLGLKQTSKGEVSK